MKKLKSLTEHNADASENHFKMNDNSPRLNNIDCQDCKKELYDSCPMMTLTSNPPQKNVHCESCNYVGYRIA